MQIIENLSRIDACIRTRQPSAEREGWDDITVQLQRAEKVDDRAELLNRRVGEEVVVSVPADLLGEAKPGDDVHGHVRVAGPGQIVAAPQAAGAAGEFRVIPT